MLSVLHSQYHACRRIEDFRSQCISTYGINPKKPEYPILGSEELRIVPFKVLHFHLQRWGCVLSSIYLWMLVNAMYYNPDSDNTTSNNINLGYLILNLHSLWVATVSLIVILPFVCGIMYIFRRCTPKTEDTPPVSDDLLPYLPDRKSFGNPLSASRSVTPDSITMHQYVSIINIWLITSAF